MRFVNFELESPNDTIELRAHGLNWDLHNFADFAGMRLGTDGSVVLTWIVPDTANPWGDTNNRYRGCELRFSGVRNVQITGRDAEIPSSEDGTLEGISKVIPEPGEHRQRREWEAGIPFHLVMKFRSGLTIEVDAADAELRALQRGAAA
jgi:hypothetical protein